MRSVRSQYPHLLAAIALAALTGAPASAQSQPPAKEGVAFGTWAQVTSSGLDLREGGAGESSASRAWDWSMPSSGYNAYAAASLGGGTLKAAALARNSAPCTPSPYGGSCFGAWTSGRAAMWDSVQLMRIEDGASVIENTLIPLEFAIDGHVEGEASARFRFFYGVREDLDLDNLGWMDLEAGVSLYNDIMLVPPLGKQFLYLELWTEALADGANATFSHADYSHTLHFKWALPEGVYAVSDSGQFLTQASAAPEPASWAIMIVGLGLSGALIRRQRAATLAA